MLQYNGNRYLYIKQRSIGKSLGMNGRESRATHGSIPVAAPAGRGPEKRIMAVRPMAGDADTAGKPPSRTLANDGSNSTYWGGTSAYLPSYFRTIACRPAHPTCWDGLRARVIEIVVAGSET